jgi:hypothetical protein
MAIAHSMPLVGMVGCQLLARSSTFTNIRIAARIQLSHHIWPPATARLWRGVALFVVGTFGGFFRGETIFAAVAFKALAVQNTGYVGGIRGHRRFSLSQCGREVGITLVAGIMVMRSNLGHA